MEQSYVILKDVRKTYHMGEVSINAADGVNFEIKKGEFVVIVGPSGAGKTTILNIFRRNGYCYERRGHCRWCSYRVF